MKVEIISETIQKFDGKNYYLCGNYYQKNGVRLHRLVWQYHNGEIPKGMHVHHKDHNKHNNQIENLALLPAKEHQAHHGKERGIPDWSREKAIRLATQWHQSAEGREWHRKNALNNPKLIAARSERTLELNCEHCSQPFFVPKIKKEQARFCSNKCKSAWRKASGVDDIDRQCVVCKTVFKSNKYNGRLACSKTCLKRWQIAIKNA